MIKLNKDDYLIMPTMVHVMRYRGRNDNGNRYWSTACGSSFSDTTWERMSYTPSLAEVAQHNLAVCKRCEKSKPRKKL